MPEHSPLLEQFLPELRDACASAPALDLACGGGRNGLYLARQGLPVTFADRRAEALAEVGRQLEHSGTAAELWRVDLETAPDRALAGRQFGAILVFRYLHRPLFPTLREALLPGGVLLYETFTRDQAELGRPRNPDFLLRPGELQQAFGEWPALHSFEGRAQNAAGQDIAIAQLVARRPR